MAISDDIIWAVLLVIFVDFYQAVQFGAIAGIGNQKLAMLIDIVTVLGFICPLAYFLGFEWFSHQEFVDPKHPKSAKTFNGLGVTGLWLAIVIAYFWQIAAYWLVLKFSNWEKICLDAL